jgi:hypothetical protein
MGEHGGMSSDNFHRSGARAGKPPAHCAPALIGPRQPAPAPLAPPATIRLPRPGDRCPHFGLSRTQFYDLIERGLIKSYTLKQPGRGRGVRLIDYKSVLEAITNQAEAA